MNALNTFCSNKMLVFVLGYAVLINGIEYINIDNLRVLFGILFGFIYVFIILRARPWSELAPYWKHFIRFLWSLFIAISFSSTLEVILKFLGSAILTQLTAALFFLFFLVWVLSFKFSKNCMAKALENGGLLWKRQKEVKANIHHELYRARLILLFSFTLFFAVIWNAVLQRILGIHDPWYLFIPIILVFLFLFLVSVLPEYYRHRRSM